MIDSVTGIASESQKSSPVLAFHRYVVFVIGGLAIYVAFAVSVNVFVDPWELYGPLRTKVSPKGVNFERVTLAHDIRLSEKFDVLLLGSSRIRYLIDRGGARLVDPQKTATFWGEGRVFNAALAGANMHQMRRVFEHALHYHPVRELVFLLDDVMLNSNRPLANGWYEYNYFGSPDYQSPLERALSLADAAMLEASVRILLANHVMTAPVSGDTSSVSPELSGAQWEQGIAEFDRRDLYGCFQIGPNPRDEFDRILVLAKQNHVKVTLLTSLIHPSLFEYFYRSDEGEGVRVFLSVIRDAALRHAVPAWYFSPFSPVTRGAPRVSYMRSEFYESPDYFDPGHANHLIGIKLLDRAIRGIEQSDLNAYRLDQQPAEEVFDSISAERRLRIQEEKLPFTEFLESHRLVAGQACSGRRR